METELALAKDSNTPALVLASMAYDNLPHFVLRAIASNPNTTYYTLKYLQCNLSSGVRKAATAALTERFP